MLEIKNLSKQFGSKAVLDDISFVIPKGTIGVLLGSSGTGKSTLLRIVSSLEEHTSGALLFNNMPLEKSNVGMVFQQFNLFENLTVKNNIIFALSKGRTLLPPAQADDVATTLLTNYGMLELADRYPDELSGGQKQRLAILRTIAQKPAIICFDEPTSALDPLLKTYIAQMITELSRSGYTILIATHDIQFVEQLTCTIFLMQTGKIIESANSKEFTAIPSNFPKIKKFIYHS